MSNWLQGAYAILMVGSCLIQVGLAIYAWQRRSTPGALTFLWLLISSAFTELCYFGLAAAPNPTIGYIWARLRFLGISLLAVHYLLFVLNYVGRHDWFRSRRYLWLYVIPALTQLIIWTNPLHQSFYTSWRLEDKDLLSAEIAHFGGWYWVHGLYSYLLVALGFGILVQNLGRARGLYRRQVWLIIIGSAVTIIASLPGSLALMDPPFNSFPIGSLITTLYLAWALFRYGLLDLVPVAHDTIFRSISEMAIVLDTHHRIVDMNPAALRLVGMVESQVIGQPAATVFGAWPALVSHLQNPEIADADLEIEAAGAKKHLVLRPSPLYDRSGELTGRVFIVRDITQRRQADQHRMALAIEREKVNVLAQFITMTAHEFRTPLSTINMNLALLERATDPESRSNRLEIVNQQIAYIANLIDTMLKMTRLDSQTTLTLSRVDPNQLFRDLETRFRTLAETRSLTLMIEPDPAVPRVHINAPVVYDALSCLVDNALRYTPKGGTITCRSYATGNGVVLEIADTGEGISPDDLPYIFDRFFRADQARSTRGAGLGLSIAKKAVEMHGGTIEVDSTLGQGSTFRIWLPSIETS